MNRRKEKEAERRVVLLWGDEQLWSAPRAATRTRVAIPLPTHVTALEGRSPTGCNDTFSVLPKIEK